MKAGTCVTVRKHIYTAFEVQDKSRMRAVLGDRSANDDAHLCVTMHKIDNGAAPDSDFERHIM